MSKSTIIRGIFFVYSKTCYIFIYFFEFLAVLFDNIGKNGSLPRHVQYRIRMDGRLFPSTKKIRSRYWFPGYSSTSAYHLYGFIWLQDQIERALIEVLTGKNVTNPGVYMQEMPYPCYLKDR